MRWTTSFIPTLREDPADAEAVSHRLMVRAGLVRQLTAGRLRVPPARPARHRQGQRDHPRGDERDRRPGDHDAGAPSRGALAAVGPLVRHQGRDVPAEGPPRPRHVPRDDPRGGRRLARRRRRSAPTASCRRSGTRSRPRSATRPRPRSGVLRTREFWMKDAYTLDADDAGLDVAYEKQKEAYERIFHRCGRGRSRGGVRRRHDGRRRRARVHGPERGRGGRDRALPGVRLRGQRGARAVEAVGAGAPPTRTAARWRRPACGPSPRCASCSGSSPPTTIKSLLYVGPAGPVLALVRGDQQLHEKKLARLLGGEVRAAHPDEVRDALGAPVGSVGPVGAAVPIVADEALGRGRTWPARTARASTSAASGRAGTSRRGYADLHLAQAGDACPACGAPLSSSA